MRHGTNSLEQQEALLRYGRIHPAADHFMNNPFVVAFRIVTKQREHEPVFAASGSVARAGIASGAEQYGHDIPAKAGDFLWSRREQRQRTSQQAKATQGSM
jgi:hypothetical protein